MGAEVQAKLKLDIAEFRRGTDQAQGAWGKLESNIMGGGKTIVKALAPAAVALAGLSASALAAGGAGAAIFGNWVGEGVALNSQLENAKNAFAAFTGDAKKANDIVMELKKEGDLSPIFKSSEIINAGKSLMSSAKGSQEELMKLIKTAELLGALNPEQGMAGAAFSLREAVSGDYLSLIERFNISRKMVKDLKAQGKEGMELVQEALKAMGVNTDLISNQANSWTGLQSRASSYFDNLKMELSEPVFEELKAGLQGFAAELSGESGQSVTEFAHSVGETLGKSTREVLENLKGINWKEVIEGAGKFAEILGKAAEFASKAASFGGSVMETVHNGADKVESWAQKALGFKDTVAEKWWNFTGAFDAADEARASAGQHFTEAQRREDMIANRKMDKDKAYQAQQAKNLAPTSQEDITAVGQRTAGQLSPQQMANRKANWQASQAQRPTAAAVNVTLNERNPMHTVMAT